MKHIALSRSRRPMIAVVVAVVLVTGLLAGFRSATGPTRVTAYFADSTGIYAGDEVRILGVPVGRIDKITPETHRVKVVFHVNHGVSVPADAKAAIVAPSLVSSRYIQLAPQYSTGTRLRSGAVIPQSRTAVPVEWDQIKGELNDLAVAMGPQGANKNGSLDRLVNAGSTALKGQGETINQTLHDLSSAIDTLNSGSGDIFGTVQNLDVFVKALAGSNQQIASLDQNLGALTGVLANDRQALRRLLETLAVAVTKVNQFVKDNHAQLATTVNGLAEITAVLAKDQGDLAQLLHAAPTAIKDLYTAYNPNGNALGAALELSNVSNASQLVCGAIATVAVLSLSNSYSACKSYLGPLLDALIGDPNQGNGLASYLLKNFGIKVP